MKIKTIQTDIAVIGGGMAGTVSAIAAARSGAKVCLIEKSGCLGGMATSGMLGELNGFPKAGKKVIGGVAREIIDTMIYNGHGVIKENVPMTSNPSILIDRVKFNSEFLKILLDEKAKDAKVNVLLHCNFYDIEIIDSRVIVTINNLYEKIHIKCFVAIDATGNANVAYKAGGQTRKLDIGKLQPISLLFRVSGVKNEIYEKVGIEDLKELIGEGVHSGMLPAKYLSISLIPKTCDAIINATRVINIDHESIEDLTRAEMEGRQQIKPILSFLKNKVPGFEKVYLSSLASAVGVRDRRRIIGRYTLLSQDILNGSKFKDSVALGGYPMDIHNSKTKTVDFKEIKGDGFYEIPYRCLLPKDCRSIIVAGKCISADDEAFGSIRVVPTVMAIGEAAGLAAYLAVEKKVDPSCINIEELQALLKKNGAVFKGEGRRICQ